jgi:hTAFII28-like protein conserved region
MSEAQRNRLEAFTRSSLQKKTMKKVLTELTGGALNDRLVMAIASVTKMHVGEIVENGGWWRRRSVDLLVFNHVMFSAVYYMLMFMHSVDIHMHMACSNLAMLMPAL